MYIFFTSSVSYSSFRTKNLSQFEYCFLDFYMRVWAFGKCQRKMHSGKPLQESYFESSSERKQSIQTMWSTEWSKQSLHLGRPLACVYTLHAELSLAVLTAL